MSDEERKLLNTAIKQLHEWARKALAANLDCVVGEAAERQKANTALTDRLDNLEERVKKIEAKQDWT